MKKFNSDILCPKCGSKEKDVIYKRRYRKNCKDYKDYEEWLAVYCGCCGFMESFACLDSETNFLFNYERDDRMNE